MHDRFKDYVTGGAFHLSLSKRQAEMLSHIDQTGSSWGILSTFHALEAKGLVERSEAVKTDDRDTLGFSKVALTEAGKALIPLLKIAGVYSELPKWEPVELPPIDVKVKLKE